MPSDTMREIRAHLAAAGLTMTQVLRKLNEGRERPLTSQNIGNRMRIETIPYKMVKQIADLCGYELRWVPKEDK